MSNSGWMVRYGSLLFDGCGDLPPCPALEGLTVISSLNAPPDGVSGWGELRTNDSSVVGVDGSLFGRDYYDVRQVTLTLTIGDTEAGCGVVLGDETGPLLDARAAVRAMLGVWKRECDNEPLIIFPPGSSACVDDDTPGLPREHTTKPVQIMGRPRVAQVTWQAAPTPIAEVTLRFDAPNQLLELTDCCGEPGSGDQCVQMYLGHTSLTRCYDCESYRCYTSGGGITQPPDQTHELVGGTECVCPTLTAFGTLTTPRWVNLQTGGEVDWKSDVPAGATLTIDPCDGTADLDGTDVSRYLFITGDLRMKPNEMSNWLFTSFNTTDTGHSQACWTPAVLSV